MSAPSVEKVQQKQKRESKTAAFHGCPCVGMLLVQREMVDVQIASRINVLETPCRVIVFAETIKMCACVQWSPVFVDCQLQIVYSHLQTMYARCSLTPLMEKYASKSVYCCSCKHPMQTIVQQGLFWQPQCNAEQAPDHDTINIQSWIVNHSAESCMTAHMGPCPVRC